MNSEKHFNDFYKKFLKYLPDIVFWIDANGKFSYMNESIQRLGYRPDELTGEHFSVIVHPDDLENVKRSNLQKTLKNNETGDVPPLLFDERRTGNRVTKNLKIRLICKNYTCNEEDILDVKIISTGFYAHSDEEEMVFLGTIGIIQDLSDVVNAEKAFIQSEKHYRMLIENSSDIISIIASDLTILYMSNSIRKNVGYDPIDLIGENLLDLINMEDRLKLLGYLDNVKHDSKADSYCSFRFLHENQSWETLETIASEVSDQEGHAMCYILNSRNITEHERDQKALRESENRYRTLFESASDPIYIHDMKNNFLQVNRVACDHLGYTREELLQMNPMDINSSEYISKVSEEIWKLQKQNHVIFETVHSKKDGSNIPVEVNARIIEYRKELVILCIARDITDRKKAEDLIKASLEEKEMLLKEIHHRVKNNMQVVSSLLRTQSAQVSNENTKKILEESQNRISAMSLIHELLYQSENLSKIDFQGFIRRLVGNLKSFYQVDNRQVEVVINSKEVSLGIDSAVPCGLIINELVANAFKYAFPGDIPGRINILMEQNENDVILVIGDNGIGLPDDFDPSKSMTMGFQLVRNIAEHQLLGEMSLLSEKGTMVSIRFPVSS